MRTDELIVEVRNPDRSREGQLLAEDLVGALFVPRKNEIGSWKVVLPATIVDSGGVRRPHHLCEVLRQEESGLIVSGPGGVILSGPMDDASYSESTENPWGEWEITGIADLIVVDDALAYGDPSKYGLAAQDAANDIQSGPAETVLLSYINRNIGPAAVAERRVPGLTIQATQGRGPNVRKTPRFQILFELAQEILTGTTLLLDVVQVGQLLEARVTEATDLSLDVRFDFANDQIIRNEYSKSAPGLTDVIVAGQGEGVARKMIRRTTAGSKWGRRRERFLDQRNTDDDTELAQAGDEKLAEAEAERTAFKIVPNTSLELIYGVDWKVGDIVSVVVAGEEIAVPITSAPIAVTANGVLVGATVGNPTSTKWEDAVDKRLRQMERRQSQYERSQ